MSHYTNWLYLDPPRRWSDEMKIQEIDESMAEFFGRVEVGDFIPMATPEMNGWDGQRGRITEIGDVTVTVSFNNREYVLDKETGEEIQHGKEH